MFCYLNYRNLKIIFLKIKIISLNNFQNLRNFKFKIPATFSLQYTNKGLLKHFLFYIENFNTHFKADLLIKKLPKNIFLKNEIKKIVFSETYVW